MPQDIDDTGFKDQIDAISRQIDAILSNISSLEAALAPDDGGGCPSVNLSLPNERPTVSRASKAAPRRSDRSTNETDKAPS